MKFALLIIGVCAVTIAQGFDVSERDIDGVLNTINRGSNKVADVWDDWSGKSPLEKFVNKLGRAGSALGINPEFFIMAVFVIALLLFVCLLKVCCCSSKSSQQRTAIIYAQPPPHNLPPYNPLKETA